MSDAADRWKGVRGVISAPPLRRAGLVRWIRWFRTYRRKVQRLAESQTVAGRSLWEAMYEYVGSRHVATRADVSRHFAADDEEIVRGVLEDLVESGLVYRAGRGVHASYRAASAAD